MFINSKKQRDSEFSTMLGQDRFQKNTGGCLVQSSEIPSSRQTSTDKTNDCVMNSEWSTLVGGSDPPKGFRLHAMAGVMWRALARHMIEKNNWSLVCTKQMTKFLDPSRTAKKKKQVWEKTVGRRQQALAP